MTPAKKRKLLSVESFRGPKRSFTVVGCRASDETHEAAEVLDLIQEINTAANFDREGELGLGTYEDVIHQENSHLQSETLEDAPAADQAFVCVSARGIIEVIRQPTGFLRASVLAVRNDGELQQDGKTIHIPPHGTPAPSEWTLLACKAVLEWEMQACQVFVLLRHGADCHLGKLDFINGTYLPLVSAEHKSIANARPEDCKLLPGPTAVLCMAASEFILLQRHAPARPQPPDSGAQLAEPSLGEKAGIVKQCLHGVRGPAQGPSGTSPYNKGRPPQGPSGTSPYNEGGAAQGPGGTSPYNKGGPAQGPGGSCPHNSSKYALTGDPKALSVGEGREAGDDGSACTQNGPPQPPRTPQSQCRHPASASTASNPTSWTAEVVTLLAGDGKIQTLMWRAESGSLLQLLLRRVASGSSLAALTRTSSTGAPSWKLSQAVQAAGLASAVQMADLASTASAHKSGCSGPLPGASQRPYAPPSPPRKRIAPLESRGGRAIENCPPNNQHGFCRTGRGLGGKRGETSADCRSSEGDGSCPFEIAAAFIAELPFGEEGADVPPGSLAGRPEGACACVAVATSPDSIQLLAVPNLASGSASSGNAHRATHHLAGRGAELQGPAPFLGTESGALCLPARASSLTFIHGAFGGRLFAVCEDPLRTLKQWQWPSWEAGPDIHSVVQLLPAPSSLALRPEPDSAEVLLPTAIVLQPGEPDGAGSLEDDALLPVKGLTRPAALLLPVGKGEVDSSTRAEAEGLEMVLRGLRLQASDARRNLARQEKIVREKEKLVLSSTRLLAQHCMATWHFKPQSVWALQGPCCHKGEHEGQVAKRVTQLSKSAGWNPARD
eukprot:jgi/Botrbrau1/19472/Bobra.0338s0089.1